MAMHDRIAGRGEVAGVLQAKASKTQVKQVD